MSEWGVAAADFAKSSGLDDVTLTSFGDNITHLAGLSHSPLQEKAVELINEMWIR